MRSVFVFERFLATTDNDFLTQTIRIPSFIISTVIGVGNINNNKFTSFNFVKNLGDNLIIMFFFVNGSHGIS